jgi:Protein of unknown function (DUF2950)
MNRLKRSLYVLLSCFFVSMTASGALALQANQSSSNVPSRSAQARPQKTFLSAEAATSALALAVQDHDEDEIVAILGTGSDLISTGDDVQDTLEREHFVQKYQEMHRVVREPDNITVLYVGAENLPFPFPLVSSHGIWRFDSQAGASEILRQRITENEAMVIGAFPLLTLAEREYQQRSEGADHEYTTRLAGASGTHNGLDWTDDNAIPQGLTQAGIDDQATTGSSAAPFYGYYFRILTAQGQHAPGGAKSYISGGKMTGGFAFVAYPAVYRSSGVKTFIAGSDGRVYEKDLGPDTAKIARTMTEYDPGPSWHLAEQYPGEALK